MVVEPVQHHRAGDSTPPVPGAARQPRVRRLQRHAVTGAGAVPSVNRDGPEAASSSVIQALRRVAPEGMSQDEQDRVHDSSPHTGTGR